MGNGGTFAGPMQGDTADYSPSDSGGFGSGLSFGGSTSSTPAPAPESVGAPSNDLPAQPQPSFGQGLRNILPGPHYTAPDPQATALDQTADTLQQRIKRANEIAANPLAQFFNPEDAQRARDFVPAATEQLQKIRQQQAGMAANRQQAATLGLNPGEVPDEASMADRVEVAKSKALQGNLAVFKGLQLVDPKTAETIQDQVSEVAGKHLGNAQLAFDSLSGMTNEGQYQAKLSQLRKEGTLTDLEALGLKVPPSFEGFNAAKGAEGKALRDARMAVDNIRNKLEARNTAQPMEKAEAETYKGAWKTVYGDAIEGQSSRIAATGARGNIIDGYDDPRKLGKGAVLATPDQRKSIKEDAELAVPKEDLEKFRANNRTYKMATTDSSGKEIPAEGLVDAKGNRVFINTNPNVQQGIAEGLASALRGGQGGANVGLLKIETSKRGYIQGLLDTLKTNYAGAINAASEQDTAKAIKPYLTQLTMREQRDVLDFLHQYNAGDIPDRLATTAKRAGALGLDAAALGFGSKEAAGPVNASIEEGRQAQIALDMQRHQAIGGGRGFLSYGALNPTSGTPQGGPPGTTPTTQLPGPGNQTPVQQAQNPQPTPPKSPPPPGGPGSSPPAASAVSQPGGGQPSAPVTIAGQSVTAPMPPGVSPEYLGKVQRIESGGSKDAWTSKSGDPKSSASGAFQFINATWAASKPVGAPARAADATPAQQAEAAATLTAKNAQALKASGLPVNDTTAYVAHNLGAGGAIALLSASPTADAKTVVPSGAGEPTFRGRPTVATVLQRYQDKMNEAPAGKEATAAAPAQPPTFMQRVSRVLSQGVPEEKRDQAVADVGNAAVEHAPAIGSAVGAIGGSAAGPAGTIAGGGAGGSAGQALKDYLQGNPQSPTKIAKEGALGAVLGVGGAARPVLSAAARVGGAAAVEGGAAAVEGGDASDITDAAVKGAGAAIGGEAFGRALGMAGHKVFSMFAPESRKAVQGAAKAYSEAEATLAAEAPKLPSVGGAAGGPNPKFEAATAAKEKAEKVLKDAGLKPDEAAYAHKVASEGVPKQEAEVARPGAVEEQRLGQDYQQLEKDVAKESRDLDRPGATPKLADGPIAAVENKQVSAKHAELAQHTEMAITAPAASWQEKWVQLKDARSALLTAERDAMSSTAPGRTKTAQDMRALADTVRVQQAKAAKYVFGEKDGEAFMGRLKVLDVRYRNLMEATNGGDLAKAAVMKGEPGREAQRKFEAFAHDDPQAIAAYRAMRGAKGDLAEATVPWTVAAEGLPVVGKVVKVAKLAGILREWARERTAGSPIRFSDLVKTDQGNAGVGQNLRDLGGTAVQRGMVQ